MHRTVAALVLLAATFAACNSDGGDGDPTVVAANAQSAADHALLTLNDFPVGWIASPPSESEFDDLDLEEDCDRLVDLFEADLEDDTLADGESDEFTGPGEAKVSSTSWVYATADESRESMTLFDDLMRDCQDELAAALESFFFEVLAEEGVSEEFVSRVKISVTRPSFPASADQAFAYRLSIDVTILGRNLEVVLDMIFLRSGRMGAALVYSAEGTSAMEHKEELAGILETRLREADRMLDRAP